MCIRDRVCFTVVSELFQAHYHIYSHVQKYANAKTVLANQRQQWRRNFPITLVYTLVRSCKYGVKHDKRWNCRINWTGVRSRRCGIVVYLNADVRKHALLTLSQHAQWRFNAFLRKLRLTAIRHDLNALRASDHGSAVCIWRNYSIVLPFYRRRLLLPF